jgi:hypothetical protein
MDAGRSNSASESDDRIRILEFQVDQLRRELEHLEARHAEAVYSVAWHIAWPIRILERLIRRAIANRNDRDGDPDGEDGAAPLTGSPPRPLTRDRVAERIAARIAHPA